MKKILIIILLMALTLMSACTETSKEEKEESVYIPKYIGKTTIDDQVIFDQNSIKITTKDIDYGDYIGPVIKLFFENDKSKDVKVDISKISVNNIMIYTELSVVIPAGSELTESLELPERLLSSAGIQEIGSIEFEVTLIDAKTWNHISDDNIVVIKSNAFDTVKQKYYTRGKAAIDENNIKLVVIDITYDGSSRTEIKVFIENNTDEEVTIMLNEIYVNGLLADPIFIADISPGKYSYENIILKDELNADINISTIENIEVDFIVYFPEALDMGFETEKIIIDFDK